MTADHFRSAAIYMMAIVTTAAVAGLGASYAAEHRGPVVRTSPSFVVSGCHRP
jgi:hypothetical protein